MISLWSFNAVNHLQISGMTMLHFFGPGKKTNYFLVFISNRYINDFTFLQNQKISHMLIGYFLSSITGLTHTILIYVSYWCNTGATLACLENLEFLTWHLCLQSMSVPKLLLMIQKLGQFAQKLIDLIDVSLFIFPL